MFSLLIMLMRTIIQPLNNGLVKRTQAVHQMTQRKPRIKKWKMQSPLNPPLIMHLNTVEIAQKLLVSQNSYRKNDISYGVVFSSITYIMIPPVM
jgi:hypothetical protein